MYFAQLSRPARAIATGQVTPPAPTAPPPHSTANMAAAASSQSAAASAAASSSSSTPSSLLERALADDASQHSHINPNTQRLAARGLTRSVLLPDVSVAVGGRDLLSLTTLRLMDGHKYGLIGSNGCGKSTLLRRIAGGQIGGWPAHLRCHLVQQEVIGSERSALQEVMAADKERTRLLAEVAALTAQGDASDGEALARLYEQLSLIDSDSAEARAAEALDELGFSEEAQAAPTLHLSGGWRMRVALAQAIFQQPDILLLDEPTNHLDLAGVMWLTQYVESLDLTCVIVSHDSAFLTAVTTDTIHFQRQQLHYYSGNLETFLKSRSDQMSNLARQQHALDSKRDHIRQSIDKMKSQARKQGHSEQKMGLVGSRQKKLARMGMEKTADGKKFNAQLHGRRVGSENDQPITTAGTRTAASLIEPEDREFRFQFPQPELTSTMSDGAPLLTAMDVSFGWGVDEADMAVLVKASLDRTAVEQQAALEGVVAPPAPPPSNSPLIFANVSLTIRAGDRIGIVGDNGLGKSVALNLLGGQLQPIGGSVTLSSGVRVARFSQQLVESLESSLGLTPVAYLLRSFPAIASGPNSEQAARQILGRFGLGGSLALQPIGVLSGGQKARCVFATMIVDSPHILLLDEPTNHLDLPTIDALCDAIESFSGAVVFVSHSQQLLHTANTLYLVAPRKPPAVIKQNPNVLKAQAAKLQKAKAAAANKKGGASASSSSALPKAVPLPSRCSFTKLAVSFEEYRESLLDEL